jgi:hypothetical protein
LARQFLGPVALAVLTTDERDALDSPADGWLVWNSDDEEIQTYANNGWETVVLDPVLVSVIGAMAVELGRVRSALRFLDIEPESFDPDMH